MKNCCFILLLLIAAASYGQSISGYIRENDKPLSLVNISLLRVKDSALQRSAVSDNNGYYKIEKIRPGVYMVRATRVGYTQQVIAVTIDSAANVLELPVIILKPAGARLNEVTVSGKRPFVEQKIDRMVVNVANSIIASGSTALEVLEKAPGILIDRQNDLISFQGKEGVLVQVDGKPTYLAMADLVAMLRNLPGDNIDRIELITNPSARYDAAGNSGIIDIRLKKNNNIGTNGAVGIGIGSGRYGRKRGSLQLNHRKAKFNFFSSYSINRDGNYFNFDIDKIQTTGAETNFIAQDSYIRVKNNGHNAKAGIDFFLDKNTTLGLVWTGFWSSSYEKSPAEVRFRHQANGPVYFETLSDKTLSNIQSNQLFNVNLVRTLSNKGQLSADFDIGAFRRQFDNNLNTETLIPNDPVEPVSNIYSYMPTTIAIVSFRVDYSKPLAKGWKMEAGIKSGIVHSDNDMKFSTGTNGNLQLDTALSNHFKYDEEVYAGYINFSGKLQAQTNILFGIRAEQTFSTGNSISLNNKVNRKYLDLFPSVFITHTLNKKNTVNFSYSYRIDRPNYQSLNPARSYIDPYTYTGGNPLLKPQYTHSLELRHGYKNKLFTAVGASFASDLVYFVVEPYNSKATQRVPDNVGTSQLYNLTVSCPLNIIKGWTMQTNLIGTYGRFQYRYQQKPFKAEQFSGTLNANNAFVFGKGWTGELSGRLNTPAVNVISHIDWRGNLDAGIQKVFSGNWRAKLSIQDIFYTNWPYGRINVPDYKHWVKIKTDTRVVLLNITYSFGNQQLKNSRQRKTAAEEEVQRTN